MYQATKDKELELVGRYLTPDQQTQYRAALDLYERAAGVAPNIRALSSAAAKATSNIKPVGASVSNNRLGIFGSISGLFSDPSNRRLYEKAFTPQSTAGRFMGEQLPSMARNAASTIDSMAGTGGALFAEGYQSGQTPMDFKNSYQLGQQDGLLGNLTEPKQVSIPRNLNAIDAAAVEALLPAYVESYNAQPLAIQFKRLVAEGDKSRIADFLGQIATKYPDFPLQRGQVTGLSSEFDLGDGTARLASDIDKMEYERRVNVSDLSAVEKARRIKDVREKGMVHKLDMALVQSPAPRVSKSPSSPMGYQYSARVQTENGSRKVE